MRVVIFLFVLFFATVVYAEDRVIYSGSDLILSSGITDSELYQMRRAEYLEDRAFYEDCRRYDAKHELEAYRIDRGQGQVVVK